MFGFRIPALFHSTAAFTVTSSGVRIPLLHCNTSVILTRARVAVSATFAMVVGGGGGGQNGPRLTRKLGKLEGRAIRRSKALSEPIRSHFSHFFVQVNIEVSRGHQRSNFRKMMVLSGMTAIISGTIIATSNLKTKQKIALETLFS